MDYTAVALTTGILMFFQFSAHGLSMEVPVARTNLAQGNYIFSVSNNAVQDGASFYVTITSKAGDIPSDCGLGLYFVTNWNPGGCQIDLVEPPVQMIAKKTKHVWTASFSVSSDVLSKHPNLCFIFTEVHGLVVNGRKDPNGYTFYEIRVHEFLSQSPELYHNKEYDFTFALTNTWRGFSVLSQKWEGQTDKAEVTESGPMLVLRHPKWSASDQYQDIPILVFARSQWEGMHNGKLSVGAGGIWQEITHNSKYVFAVSSRFNAADSLKGWQEATDLVEQNRAANPSRLYPE